MSENPDPILLVISDTQVTYLLERVLHSKGYTVKIAQDRAAVMNAVDTFFPCLAILGEKLNDIDGIDLAAEISRHKPGIPMILFINQESPELLHTAMRLGISEFLALPLRADDILHAVKNTLDFSKLRHDAILTESRRATASLQQRLDEVETLARLARSITSSLDLDVVLSEVVDAAVKLTDAEEGSLLLIDKESGELYMRAARNFQEEFVRTFRLPVKDSLAGQVIRSGKPVLLDDKTPQKIKTTYLVQSLLYVPMVHDGQPFGILGVDNRQNHLPFTERHTRLLDALAEFAVIAIDNSRHFADTMAERNKLQSVLTHVHEGVIILDQDQRVMLVNDVVRETLGLGDAPLAGRPFRDIFNQPTLIELLDSLGQSASDRGDLELENGSVFTVRVSPIPDVGLGFTLTDITNLKKLDQIKTDFVHTVSHDLRSPLTAILGYVELIERAGPVNDLQRDFIRRVQVSVHNITSLVDDLLDLGRIESGFDTRKEFLQLDQIIRYAADGFKKRVAEKGLTFDLRLPENMPPFLANPVQMREMMENMLDNAIKYTPANGSMFVSAQVEQEQVILQVGDSGMGIPSLDLPYIFDKFYRASNASAEVVGTGLGLAIVRSIVENHHGRIWVDSTPGKGTTFTIVLPIKGG